MSAPSIAQLGWSVDTTADRLLDQLAVGTAESVDPIGTGWDPLDAVLEGGLRPEDLVILGGKPGVGKTIALLQWARAAAEACRPVAYVSFEHSPNSLLRRLLVSEIATIAGERLDPSTMIDIRRAVRRYMEGGLPLAALRASHPVVDEAHDRLRTDGPFLSLERGNAVDTDLEAIKALVESKLGHGGVLIVDYLQKVPSRDGRYDADGKVVATTSRLKEMALAHGVVVVAASAANDSGLAGRRVRLDGLRGGSGLAHEADVALLMNDKVDAVSRMHGAFDLTLLTRYAAQMLFTIEKNRDGVSPLHLQFDKDFANFRFIPSGSFVSERIVGDGLVDE